MLVHQHGDSCSIAGATARIPCRGTLRIAERSLFNGLSRSNPGHVRDDADDLEGPFRIAGKLHLVSDGLAPKTLRGQRLIHGGNPLQTHRRPASSAGGTS